MSATMRRGIAAGLGLVAVAAAFVYYTASGDGSIPLEDVRSRGVVYLEEERVFLVADGDDVLALSADSPGRDARLLYCPALESFRGPHGEGFNLRGEYFAGPAPRDMDSFAVHVTGDEVEVDLSDRTVAGGRSKELSRELAPGGRLCRFREGAPGFALPPRS